MSTVRCECGESYKVGVPGGKEIRCRACGGRVIAQAVHTRLVIGLIGGFLVLVVLLVGIGLAVLAGGKIPTQEVASGQPRPPAPPPVEEQAFVDFEAMNKEFDDNLLFARKKYVGKPFQVVLYFEEEDYPDSGGKFTWHCLDFEGKYWLRRGELKDGNTVRLSWMHWRGGTLGKYKKLPPLLLRCRLKDEHEFVGGEIARFLSKGDLRAMYGGK